MNALFTGEIQPTPENVLDVHGGITYAGYAHWRVDTTLWFFGFDCGHFQDRLPAMDAFWVGLAKERPDDFSLQKIATNHVAHIMQGGQHYRTLEFVQQQANGLAEQLVMLAWEGEEAAIFRRQMEAKHGPIPRDR